MRFMFKTDYEDDIRAVSATPAMSSPTAFCLALLLIAPFVLSQLSRQPAGLRLHLPPPSASGLMILTGFTGQASLGHAALSSPLAPITAAYLQQFNVPFPVYFSRSRPFDRHYRRAGRISGAAAAGHLIL